MKIWAPGLKLCLQTAALSLVELLVVIAIIAILAALLLPGLSSAKNQAAKTTDLNNLRQIMAAVHLYAGDNRDVMTWPNWDYGQSLPDGTNRAGWLYNLNPALSGPARFDLEKSLLWNALSAPKVFLCPMDSPNQAAYSKHNSSTEQRAEQLSSYIMNGAVIGFRTGYYSNATPVKLTQMPPGACILFEGDGSDPFSFNDGSSWPSEGITAHHLLGGTTAAADGSSTYITDAAWRNQVAETNKNNLWCYPNTANGGDPVYGHVSFQQ